MATKTNKGLNPKMYLAKNVLQPEKVERIPTRNGYGEGLVEAGKDKKVVAMCADLSESTRSSMFRDAYPDRYIQIGVSEQCMPSIAAGLALSGKVPFLSSYAAFAPGRCWEQIRTGCALQNVNVKIAGAHAGISVGPDGATHQPIEDIATVRSIPRMTVMVPCDSIETKKVTVAAAKTKGPMYFRFAREKTPVFTTAKTPFKIGRAETYRFGDDLTIIGAGPLLYEALIAAENLSKESGIEVRVINMHTIKPLDVKAIVKAAKETGAIVTVEEANVIGGLGGAVSEALAATVPVPVERIGVQDHFGESGSPDELLDAFGLTSAYIALAADRVLARKAGKKVSDVPAYIKVSKEKQEKMAKEIMDEALSRVPRKWGGKKPDSSLKSRKRK